MIQVFFLLAVSILVSAGGQLFLKKGVLALGNLEFSFANIFSLIPRVLQNIWLLSGLFLFGVSFIVWLFLLSKIQLNVIYPVSAGLTFALIAVVSWFWFGEYLSLIQILGIAIIILGTFLLL